jgi:hypothetical protein
MGSMELEIRAERRPLGIYCLTTTTGFSESLYWWRVRASITYSDHGRGALHNYLVSLVSQ